MAGRALTDAQREAADRARREAVEQLHEQLADGIANLDDKDAWQRWLGMASKLHRYSFNNVMLTMLQKPDATMIAGYRAWQAMGHQVRRGEKAIKILGPVTRKVELVNRHTGEPIRDNDGRTQFVRQLVGVGFSTPPSVGLVSAPPAGRSAPGREFGGVAVDHRRHRGQHRWRRASQAAPLPRSPARATVWTGERRPRTEPGTTCGLTGGDGTRYRVRPQGGSARRRPGSRAPARSVSVASADGSVAIARARSPT